MRDMRLRKNKPRHRAGAYLNRGASVAAAHQLPAGSPGGRYQSADIAAAISVTAVVGRAADIDARARPAVMIPSAVVTIAPGGGGGRCQRSRTQRYCCDCNKR